MKHPPHPFREGEVLARLLDDMSKKPEWPVDADDQITPGNNDYHDLAALAGIPSKNESPHT